MKDQFLVYKQARGHMSSETQGKVIEDEYARAGQTPCGQSLQEERRSPRTTSDSHRASSQNNLHFQSLTE